MGASVPRNLKPCKCAEGLGDVMADQVSIGGRILIGTDQGPMHVEWLDWNGRVWIATLWLLSPDQKWQRPLRIIAPKFAPGMAIRLEPDHVAELFLKMPLPISLLEHGQILSEISPVVEVRENPDIFAPNPIGSSSKLH